MTLVMMTRHNHSLIKIVKIKRIKFSTKNKIGIPLEMLMMKMMKIMIKMLIINNMNLSSVQNGEKAMV